MDLSCLEDEEFCFESFNNSNKDDELVIMNGLYKVVIHANIVYLRPVYWKQEDEVWILARGTWLYEIPKFPPLTYFSELDLVDINQELYFQPIPLINEKILLPKNYQKEKSSDLVLKCNPGWINWIRHGFGYFENCIDLRILRGNTNNMYHRSFKKHEFSELIFVVHGIGHHMGEHGIVGNTNDIRSNFYQYLKKFTNISNQPMLIPIAWRHLLPLNDEKLKSVSMARGELSTISVILNDVLYYANNGIYKNTIITSAISQMNTKYAMFLKNNPEFSGSVSILAHSLGSVIAYDALHEHRDELIFKDKINLLFLIGSPLGLFLTNNAISHENLIKNTFMKNGKIFNIFHSDDPVAHRIEPLFHIDYKNVAPLATPLQSEFRKTFANKLEISIDEAADLEAFYRALLNRTDASIHGNISVEYQIPNRIDLNIKTNLTNNRFPILKQTFGVANWLTETIQAHTCYWNRPEVIAIMAKFLYNITPNSMETYNDFKPYDRSIVSSKACITPMMVSRVIKRFEENGSNDDRPGRGRKKTARSKRNILRTNGMIYRNPTTKANSTRKLAKKLEGTIPKDLVQINKKQGDIWAALPYASMLILQLPISSFSIVSYQKLKDNL
uniref:DDHD domain-containing protein n=1 Tax=Acrobeloides nanus TaxID=290746 RepID=A0A914DWB4_9BILA